MAYREITIIDAPSQAFTTTLAGWPTASLPSDVSGTVRLAT